MPGKRTLTDALAPQRVAGTSPAPAVQMQAGGSMHEEPSAPTAAGAVEPTAPRPTIGELFRSRKPVAPVDRAQLATPAVQMRSGQAAHAPAAVQAAAACGVATPASQLPHQDDIQRSFRGHDISQIQAHTGSEAAAAVEAMGAKAYAAGDHVVLGNSTDLHTSAHEAAHVVQQRGGVQLKDGVGQAGDVYEQHADAVASAVVAGRSAAELLEQTPRAGYQHGVIQRSPLDPEAQTQRSQLPAQPSVMLYSDMLAAVQAARRQSDHACSEDPRVQAQILALLEPVERRLDELNDHQGRLAQFGAGNIAGQMALDTSEAAIRSWLQRLRLGATVNTDEFVLRFRMGAEVLQFLTGEQRNAPTLREFNHVSRLVGLGAGAAVLAPALIALASEEASLLAFAGRVSAQRVALWAVSNPAAALASSEALLGFGLQIGEEGWQSFWEQLRDPQGRWFIVAQVLTDYVHVRMNVGNHSDPSTTSARRPGPAGADIDVAAARQQIARVRAVLEEVQDAAENTGHAAARSGAQRDSNRHEPLTPATNEGSILEPPGAGARRTSSDKPYLDNPHPHVEQREPDWCGAACGEMSARRLGAEIDQSDLVTNRHFIPKTIVEDVEIASGGFHTDGLAAALSEVVSIPGRRWVGGEIMQDISTPQGLRTHLGGYLSATKASIILRVSSGRHWIVVDAVLPDGNIVIRDPAAKNSSIVTAEQLSSRRPTGSAVFSFEEKKP